MQERPGLVFDVGKTHLKLTAIASDGSVLHRESGANAVVATGPYAHFDVAAIRNWFVSRCRAFRDVRLVGAIAVTTHGSAAALVAPGAPDGGLVLPVPDYEFDGVRVFDDDYMALRSSFDVSYSPALPAGLNLGRQLYWLQRSYPAEFAGAQAILMYPQYFAWWLSGVQATEVTSLGCHSDLWEPLPGRFSALVDKQGWRALFPPLRNAWDSLGVLTPQVQSATGLPADCRVVTGIHDSNASYLRYLRRADQDTLATVSTGTWAITMSPGTSLGSLDENRDMLANVDAAGNPVACARFMGGREMEAICQRSRCALGTPYKPEDVGDLIKDRVFALPDFSGGSGPFGGRTGEVIGSYRNGRALAAVYAALMIDYELDLLGVRDPVVLEGSFLDDPLFARILARLRRGQSVFSSTDATGTVQGCAQLLNWEASPLPLDLALATPIELQGLPAYRDSWRELVETR